MYETIARPVNIVTINYDESVTSAALIKRLESYEFAIPERVLMVHGATIIPSVKKEPLAKAAATSLLS